MEDSHCPKMIYQWTPHGRRRRGRPQQSWKDQVTDFMRSYGFGVWEWMDSSWLYTRCTRKSLMVLLIDGPTEKYFAYEFDTMSVCAPGINLQAHTN